MTADDLVVGIVGGMGPAATVDLLRRIIALTPASDDADHLRILVDNNPRVPSRIAALLDGDGVSPAPAIAAMARGLVDAGAEVLAMPCNTAHYYYDEIAAQVDVPFINLIEVVAEALSRDYPRARRLGLLGSTAIQSIDLYGSGLVGRGIATVFPSPPRQAEVMDLIRAVKANAAGEDARAIVDQAGDDLAAQGVDVVLVACTELSALGESGHRSLPLIDAADLLAAAVVDFARAGAAS